MWLGNRIYKGSERWARILGEIEETPYQKHPCQQWPAVVSLEMFRYFENSPEKKQHVTPIIIVGTLYTQAN